ncbi:MAG: carbamoyl-phosphate synthase large subunit [Candidatus ainarchaeum sp.]|nr:carbamoyl-phosphate synthase large subunit [Candidatus ainarchaeum sp.]
MNNIERVLVIGSGPIVIGQSAEFDYSGTQACRALKEENLECILVNSNPATIQTDKETANIVYIEPLDVKTIKKIIEIEKPDSLLATVGGQTALNLALELENLGILKENGVNLIGTDAEAIECAESREKFNKKMEELGVPVLESYSVKNCETACEKAEKIGYPVIVRPAFTLGGSGGGFAENKEELIEIVEKALKLSLNCEVLIEKSITGWEEFEYEVIRDSYGNSIIICNMENIDPMGIHTGESIVVAPSQTLSNEEHQILRNTSIRIVNGLDIRGGCNVQFALNRKENKFVVIEVNPRLSRSSALASKATGYPIARIATKIAIGKSLSEILNPIIQKSAAMEPVLDYIVVKIPRWPFDKFSSSNRKLGTQMKSTGETMGIGRTFEEALQKAVNSLDIKFPKNIDFEKHLFPATDLRLFAILEAFKSGKTTEEIEKITKINKWFLRKIKKIMDMEKTIENSVIDKKIMENAKKLGFGDEKIAKLKNKKEEEIREIRKEYGIVPTYKMVDSCAGEFEAVTPYFYSTYEKENEAKPIKSKKAIILGSGPIRIGQGIEFDYCCSHAAKALKELGIKSIMVNNNPETVSTDFDSSDRLYFEPINYENVMNIIENEDDGNLLGVIVQLGGQTSLNIAKKLKEKGVKILGTGFEGIDAAEDRKKFKELVEKLGIKQPESITVQSKNEAIAAAEKLGFPIIVRPSYVIAGRGMQIVFSNEELEKYIEEAVEVSDEKPVLIDKYLENAIECEVDAVSDSENVLIGGVMEHIELAGVHSGDANIVIPSINLPYKISEKIKKHTNEIARALKIKGFLNMQYAVKDNEIYILEANPRASRTIPFLSKAIDIPLVKYGIEAMFDEKIKIKEKKIKHYAVKSVVFPFLKLPGGDILLGPEMKSTGETMGLGEDFETAYYKALKASGIALPKNGSVLITLKKEDRVIGKELAEKLTKLGFTVYATPGTGLEIRNVANVILVSKIGGNEENNILDVISNRKVDLVINTPEEKESAYSDGFKIRRKSIEKNIPCITNIRTAVEFVDSLEKCRNDEFEIKRFWEYG